MKKMNPERNMKLKKVMKSNRKGKYVSKYKWTLTQKNKNVMSYGA